MRLLALTGGECPLEEKKNETLMVINYWGILDVVCHSHCEHSEKT